MPTASTLLPQDPSIVLRYRLKSSGKIDDEILRSTHCIQVSALRARSPVSNFVYFIIIIINQVLKKIKMVINFHHERAVYKYKVRISA